MSDDANGMDCFGVQHLKVSDAWIEAEEMLHQSLGRACFNANPPIRLCIYQ